MANEQSSRMDIDSMSKSGALFKSMAHFARPKGPDLVKRTEAFALWQDKRRNYQVWPFSRSLSGPPCATSRITYEDGQQAHGINFASQDYLSLSSHISVIEAAERALRDFGPHSAGSPCLLGNTATSLQLEQALADKLQMEHVLLFPTGWGAGFGTIVGLVRPLDYIVMDELAHACLQSGAFAATPNIFRFRHLNVAEARRSLQEIRSKNSSSAILVITEGLFSMDSDMPDVEALQAACHEYGATLMVDIAHDFGAIGPEGTGRIGLQRMLGKVDLVMGSFSKTFASNGGFLATNSHSLKQFVKFYGGPHTFSNALSPVQAATVHEALRIVCSQEGEELRTDLMAAVKSLRKEFETCGIHCMGEPSAIVPVPLGKDAIARATCALLYDRNVFVNLVEFPAVPVGASRFRMQVMAKHTVEQTKTAARVVVDAFEEAQALLVDGAN